MPEPTYGAVFGSGALQDADKITIFKPQLQVVGFIPAAVNTAESILVALMLLAQQELTEEKRALDPANRNVTIFYSGQDLITQANTNYRRDAFSLLLYKPQSLAPVVPADY